MISVPIEFQKLTRLKQLDLSGTLISDGDLERLQTLTTLRHLSLNDSFVTEDGVARLQQVLIECVIESDC